jgi:hypothetical protein
MEKFRSTASASNPFAASAAAAPEPAKEETPNILDLFGKYQMNFWICISGSVADPLCLSRILIFIYPGSNNSKKREGEKISCPTFFRSHE